VFTLEGERLGRLMDVLPAGGNDIFVVRDNDDELLIPALRSVVRKIDLAQHRIEVSLPPGLREIYET
jgi:16S rRNA processing protein RimM